jgi:SEC-C motif-containing protein
LKFSVNDFCPCGSLKKYKKCCKFFHDKITFPKTALELMKSRFSAFAVSNSDYIIFTTHENNPDFTTEIKSWSKDILNFSNNTEFKKLEILEFIDDEIESFVTFKATLIQGKENISFIEKSRFLKVEGIWKYVDGNFLN